MFICIACSPFTKTSMMTYFKTQSNSSIENMIVIFGEYEMKNQDNINILSSW